MTHTTAFRGRLLDVLREHNYPDGTPKYRLIIERPDTARWERYVEDSQFAYTDVTAWTGRECVFVENTFYRIVNIGDPETWLFLWRITGEVGGRSVDMYLQADDQAAAHRKAIDMLDPQRVMATSLLVEREWTPSPTPATSRDSHREEE